LSGICVVPRDFCLKPRSYLQQLLTYVTAQGKVGSCNAGCPSCVGGRASLEGRSVDNFKKGRFEMLMHLSEWSRGGKQLEVRAVARQANGKRKAMLELGGLLRRFHL
jgi:hypothetical protein